MTEEERVAFARLCVLALPHDQKIKLARILRRDGRTLQYIAGWFGVSVGTAYNWTATVELFKVEKLVGRDGKYRPPRYKPRVLRRAV